MRPLRVMQARGVIGAAYLDGLATTPRAALSLRKLISTATVSIRVRRSSDSAEQDIGFTGNALDTASLATFVGSNSAYVTKFYDQTGNSNDIVQATSGKQARIVNAGTYDGKLVFNGTAHGMATSGVLVLGTAYVGIYTKHGLPGSYGSNEMFYELSPDAIANAGGSFVCLYQSGWNTLSRNGLPTRGNVFTPSWSALTQASFLFDNTFTNADEIKLFVGGSAQTGTPSQTGDQTGNFRSDKNLYVGARNNSSLYCRLDLETMVIYNADTSAIRSSIEAIVA